jgi:hypothetical protein
MAYERSAVRRIVHPPWRMSDLVQSDRATSRPLSHTCLVRSAEVQQLDHAKMPASEGVRRRANSVERTL